MANDSINLKITAVKRPAKLPRAEKKASLPDIPLISDATNAPTNGPKITPKGGNINSPNINPIVAPCMASLLPLASFVPQIGSQ